MRSSLAAVAVSLLAPMAVQAEVVYQVRDTADLVALCDSHAASDAPTALAFCHGFLVGAAHYKYASMPEPSRFVCPPDPAPSRAEVMNGFVSWAQANSQYMGEPAVETLFRYLAVTFPCP